LAPEIVMGKGYSRSVDWWSLGILIYEMLVGLPPFYSENMNEMYDLILKAPLEFPSEIPSDAKSLVKGLLERNISKRLGCSKDDFEEIKAHPFFESIDWEKLYAKKITPPFIPKNSETNDAKAKYFDPEFTKEKVQDSFAVPMKKEVNVSFEGFEYNSEEK
jgi:serum/glucocorticoid-regulated kinase 2